MQFMLKVMVRWATPLAMFVALTACGGGGGGGGSGASPIASLTASQSSITLGSSVILTPTFRVGSASLSPNPATTPVVSGVGISVSPEITTAYQLTVTYTDPNTQRVVTSTVSTTITVTEPTDKFISAGKLTGTRSGAAYAVLTNDIPSVLACGGQSSSIITLNTCEIFEPVSQAWTLTGPMKAARRGHTMTELPNGKVLVVGGTDGKTLLTTAELYDATTRLWTAVTGVLARGRANHTATLLRDGTVLIAGGDAATGDGKTSEIFDPSTGLFTATAGTMVQARVGHTATRLSDGLVLVTGKNPAPTFETQARTTEIYDPSTGLWSAGSAMISNRYSHAATLLSNGNVLVTGGFGDGTNSRSAEIYDPFRRVWATTTGMQTARALHTATLLPDGRVLVIGGYHSSSSIASSEIANPEATSWTYTLSLKQARAGHSAVRLPNNKVLVFGAYADSGNFFNTSEIFWE